MTGMTNFYLNGQSSPNSPANFVIEGVIPNQPLVLGAQRATDDIDSIFTGELIELRIWSRALSPSEVAEFGRGVIPGPSDPKLVDYQSIGANGVREDLENSSEIFLPFLNNDIKSPLLSGQATIQALQVSPDKGGMKTLAYSNLSGVEFSLEFWAQINTDGYIMRGVGANKQVNISLAREGDAIKVLVNCAVPRIKGSSIP